MTSIDPNIDSGLTPKSQINPQLDPEWQTRFQTAAGIQPDRYLLSNPGDIIVTEQLHCYPKAEKKFRSWHRPGLVYTRLALEQSSGEIAAMFKSGLMHGKEIWDLTGGLGMDTFAFSQRFEIVHYCEPAEQPFILARHNHTLLGADNIRHHGMDAATALASITKTDWIYMDPSRRDRSGRKFLLSDCEPDVVQLLGQMRQKAFGIMIKLSPMYDLHRLVEEIPSITRIYVVSVHGEVREILALIDEITDSKQVTAVILPEEITYSSTFPIKKSGVMTQSVPQTRARRMSHSMSIPDPRQIPQMRSEPESNALSQPEPQPVSKYQSQLVSEPVSNPPSRSQQDYLQVADASIFKAGLAEQVRSEFHGGAFGSGGYFLTTNSHVPGCKSYKVLHMMEYKPKELRKKLKNTRVNIHKRNFSIEVGDIYKSLGTAMGDDLHLFFTQKYNGQKLVAICEPPVIPA